MELVGRSVVSREDLSGMERLGDRASLRGGDGASVRAVGTGSEDGDKRRTMLCVRGGPGANHQISRVARAGGRGEGGGGRTCVPGTFFWPRSVCGGRLCCCSCWGLYLPTKSKREDRT